MNINHCDSLQNLNGLQKSTKITDLDFSDTKISILPAGLNKIQNLNSVNLNSCSLLENIDGLDNCNKVTTLDLSNCKLLKNVDGLANLRNLNSLNLSKCKNVTPRPSPVIMTTREQVIAYQNRIKNR